MSLLQTLLTLLTTPLVTKTEGTHTHTHRTKEREFVRALDACFSNIQRNPESHALVHPRVRRALLRRFPYGVFYVVGERHISVIACLHVRRRPGTWKARI